jgi:hypothetical protein
VTCARRWLALLASLVPLAAVAEPPPRSLWVASRAGGALEAAFAAGATVLDAFGEAVVLGDDASAEALQAAGFAVDGPWRVDAAETVLLAARKAGAFPDGAAWASADGVRVLWLGTSGALVAARRPLPTSPPFDVLRPRILSGTLRRPAPPLAAPLRATTFDPRIDAIAAAVDSVAYFPWIRRLSGAEPVIVGGESVTFTTRHTLQPMCDLAEQYVYERFLAMGFPQVEYDTYSAFGTTARNIVATLPGAEAPEEVVIVCGHLDSTSPYPATNAPGANDNASGTAGVLAAAEVLRPWTFHATLRFVAFTGEEQGLLGSDHYAALVAASPDSILGVVNLDMIAYWATRRRIDIEGEPFCAPIMQVMQDACLRYTALSTVFVYDPWGSDHVSFSDRNMPAFLAIESDWDQYPCYHKTCDTWEKNLGGFGSEVARASIATAAHLAGLTGAVSAPLVAVAPVRALAAWPSPFVDAVTILLPPADGALRTLAVHDVAGRRVRTLLERGGAAAGPVVWDGRADDGRAVPDGVYFVRLRGDARASAVKVVRRR